MKMTESLSAHSTTRDDWFVVDATDLPLGRMASEIAFRLRGKHKPAYTPHVDNGDNIIVINAEKIRLTGRKDVQREFHWHTGHPGGIRSETPEDTLKRHPDRLVIRAVERMMPRKTKLGRACFTKLHVYVGAEHPHTAQKPAALNIGEIIAKKNHK